MSMNVHQRQRVSTAYTGVVPKELADILRDAVRKSGLPQYALAEKADVPQSRLSTFMAGGDLTLRNASKLAKVLGLTLKKAR
jgi:plasmid maintenance system antidote protein VapI